ncbi:hypothetical protein BH11ACT3_BH11ACT3_11350 [soil metagenome]
MRVRNGVTILTALLLTLPLLAACSGPVVDTTPETEAGGTAPDLVPIDGQWLATRTLTSTTVTNEAITVGDTDQRSIVFADTECDDAGACAGTFKSAADFTPEGLAAGLTGDFAYQDGHLTFEVSSTTDCVFTDGTVAFANAFGVDSRYDLVVDDTSSITGTLTSEISTTAEAITAGCPESAGERIFDVLMVPASE